MQFNQKNEGSRVDVSLFVLAFFAGIAAIFICKALSAPQLVLTSLVIGVIVLYGLIVWVTPRLRLRLDQAGDNAYYLGLLFTLISMAYALHSVATDVSTVDVDSGLPASTTERIIADFGVALGSTIAGIFIRIFLQQIRIDPSDVETTTRLELSSAAELLRGELLAIASSMRSFHEGLQQSASDLSQKLLAEFATTTQALRVQVVQAGEAFTKELESATAALPPQISTIQTRLEETGAELNQTIAKLKGATTPLTQIGTRLGKVGDSLVLAGQSVESLTGHVNGGLEQVEKGQKRIGDLITHVEGLVQRMPQRDKELVLSIESHLKSLEQTQLALSALVERQASAVKILGDHSGESINAVRRAQQASSDVLTALTGLTRELEGRVRTAAAG